VLVDAHMHVNFNRYSTADVIRYLDNSRIDCCWLLTWEETKPGGWPYTHLSVEDVWDAYSRYPSRIIPMYAPDPSREDASITLESWYQKGVRGCGELKATLNWASESVRSLLKAVDRLRMPLVFHMEGARQTFGTHSTRTYDRLLRTMLGSTSPRYAIPRRCLELLARAHPLNRRIERISFPGYMLDTESLEDALRGFPGVSFVAHGPAFWKHISADAMAHPENYPRGNVVGEGIIWRLLAEHPNLYVDTSGESGFNALSRDPANAKRFLSLFEDKVLYGTDNWLKGQKGFLDSLGLTNRTYRKIYGENAFHLVSR